jgi:ATP-dependent Zn protease
MNARNAVPQPPNLATYVAVMCVRRAIRHFIRSPKADFVIAIKLADFSDVKIYEAAARLLLHEQEIYDESGRYKILVEKLKDLPKSGWDCLSKIREIQRAILFYTDEAQIPEDAALAIDQRIALTPPSPKHFEIAAKRLRLTIQTPEAAFLSTQSLRDLRMAHRSGRSVSRIVRQLKSKLASESIEDAPPPPRKFGEYRLEELAGYGAAKQWGLSLAVDFEDWKRGDLDWNDMDRGALLNGPPGCGKTSFATALAKSCGVTLLSVSYAVWQAQGHQGDMLRAMRGSFAEAHALRPCILFIDEFDSFGNRSVGSDRDHNDYKRQVVNALLECLDPAGGREGIVVVGATNDAEKIDRALLRPGRLERIIDIPRPGDEDRAAILRHHLRGAEIGDLSDFIRASEGWSGADIEQLARQTRRIARASGRAATAADINLALPPRIEFTKEERLRLAVHEAGHTVVGYALRPDMLEKVRINTGKTAGVGWSQIGVTQFRESNAMMTTASYHADTIAILMAGVAAEKGVLGEHSTAAGGNERADLALATDIATMMERSFGFGDGWLADSGSGNRPLEYLRLLDPELRNAVKGRLDCEFKRASEIIRSRRSTLQRLTEMLLDHLELSVADVRRVWAEEGG